MKIISDSISISTNGFTDIKDLTQEVRRKLKEANINDGIITLFVPGSTGAVTTIEFEPNLCKDMKEVFEKLIPSGIPYHHEKTWGDDNGSSHLRASFIGPSLTIPISNGNLTLGTWQQIVFIDFDTQPRRREVILKIMGK
ncbi:MAG: secondary thiamine-phosphate synthase enzyme YjbQ [Candidatus Aminicenantia bacterium]